MEVITLGHQDLLPTKWAQGPRVTTRNIQNTVARLNQGQRFANRKPIYHLKTYLKRTKIHKGIIPRDTIDPACVDYTASLLHCRTNARHENPENLHHQFYENSFNKMSKSKQRNQMFIPLPRLCFWLRLLRFPP